MNTTGRREQATREVGQFFIASAEALASLGSPPEIHIRDLGALAPRGRVEPIHAFCVEHSKYPVVAKPLPGEDEQPLAVDAVRHLVAKHTDQRGAGA
jgi:hypothetical protein